jgi:hypothetical protein
MSEKILAAEWPIKQIIKKCFPEYVVSSNANIDLGLIIDNYNMENNLDYSLSKYDLFPDVLKYGKYYKDDKKNTVDIGSITNNRREIRSAFEKRKLENLEHVKYISMKYATFVEDY